MLRELLNDDFGMAMSIEYIVIATMALCGTVVGAAALRDALANEWNDLSHAVGALSQTYSYTGIKKSKLAGKPHAECTGAGFNDDADECDCKVIEYTDVCGKDDPSTGGDE